MGARHAGALVLVDERDQPVTEPRAACYSFAWSSGSISVNIDRGAQWDDVPAGVTGWGIVDVSGELIGVVRLTHPVEQGDTVTLTP